MSFQAYFLCLGAWRSVALHVGGPGWSRRSFGGKGMTLACSIDGQTQSSVCVMFYNYGFKLPKLG